MSQKIEKSIPISFLFMPVTFLFLFVPVTPTYTFNHPLLYAPEGMEILMLYEVACLFFSYLFLVITLTYLLLS